MNDNDKKFYSYVIILGAAIHVATNVLPSDCIVPLSKKECEIEHHDDLPAENRVVVASTSNYVLSGAVGTPVASVVTITRNSNLIS